MTATDADALLATIRANPEDDAPRLVYADWLDEHGESERAEFIRVQIARARGAGCSIVCSSDEGHTDNCPIERESAAWNAWAVPGIERAMYDRTEWSGLSGRVVGWSPGWVVAKNPFDEVRYGFCRGFVAEVRAPLATLIGGVCGRCKGHPGRTIVNQFATKKCPACRGTGRTPGLRDLVRREPVEAVRVTDRAANDGSGGFWYGWDNRGRGDDPEFRHALPSPLMGILARLENSPSVAPDFPTREAADAALSRAVLAYLRADG